MADCLEMKPPTPASASYAWTSPWSASGALARNYLKIRWWKHRAGSSPARGTREINNLALVWSRPARGGRLTGTTQEPPRRFSMGSSPTPGQPSRRADKGSPWWDFRQFGCRIFMRFVVEVTESASHGTPLTADTLRRFSSAAMPYGDIPARHKRKRHSDAVRNCP